MKKTITVKSTARHTAEITADDIRQKFRLPADAQIVFRVPMGGDYAGIDLDVAEHPLAARWETAGKDRTREVGQK